MFLEETLQILFILQDLDKIIRKMLFGGTLNHFMKMVMGIFQDMLYLEMQVFHVGTAAMI